MEILEPKKNPTPEMKTLLDGFKSRLEQLDIVWIRKTTDLALIINLKAKTIKLLEGNRRVSL